MNSTNLFDPISIRGITARNRAWMSPMCQYSAVDGLPNDWHMVHLGSRAVGGAGLIMTEATGVEPEGRITPGCTGIWNDDQVEAWSKIVRFLEAHEAVPAMQLAHAGRKASCHVPWSPIRGWVPLEQGGWTPRSVGDEKFIESHGDPHMLTTEEVSGVIQAFVDGAKRALDAGFKVIEIHGAHGYLLHQFYSPISNKRTDAYGGDWNGRVRLIREVTREVRKVWPEELPLFVRLSVTEWVEGGWTIEDSVKLSKLLKEDGADLIDCSSGGATPDAQVTVSPGYQVPFAQKIRHEAGIMTGAVGMITHAQQAQSIITEGQADAVFLGKALLDDPYWAIHAARELGVGDLRSKEYSWVKL